MRFINSFFYSQLFQRRFFSFYFWRRYSFNSAFRVNCSSRLYFLYFSNSSVVLFKESLFQANLFLNDLMRISQDQNILTHYFQKSPPDSSSDERIDACSKDEFQRRTNIFLISSLFSVIVYSNTNQFLREITFYMISLIMYSKC